jgi:hypothetical protein
MEWQENKGDFLGKLALDDGECQFADFRPNLMLDKPADKDYISSRST